MHHVAMIEALCLWADEKDVDLNNCTLSTFSREFKFDYSNKDENGEATKILVDRDEPSLRVEFDMEKQHPEALRALKKAVGKAFTPEGSPEYGIKLVANLEWAIPVNGGVRDPSGLSIDALTFNVHITIRGAYECTYTCKAKTPLQAAMGRVLTDGALPEEPITSASWEALQAKAEA